MWVVVVPVIHVHPHSTPLRPFADVGCTSCVTARTHGARQRLLLSAGPELTNLHNTLLLALTCACLLSRHHQQSSLTRTKYDQYAAVQPSELSLKYENRALDLIVVNGTENYSQ